MAKTLYSDRFINSYMEKKGNRIMVTFLRVDTVYGEYAYYLPFSSDPQI
jgi:hypothetical protein